MKSFIAYLKTPKGRTTVLVVAAFLILIMALIYLFRRVKDSGEGNVSSDRLEALNKLLDVENQHLKDSIAVISKKYDSLEVKINSRETLIIQKTIQNNVEIIRWRDATVRDIESAISKRYFGKNP